MDTIELCRGAWAATKSESAPAYDDLTEGYRDMLTKRADAILLGEYVSDGPFHNFEQTVQDEMRRAGEQAAAQPVEPKGKLPEDFPARDKLHDAGINTYTQLSKAGDLTEIDGIGPATAKKIEERLEVERGNG